MNHILVQIYEIQEPEEAAQAVAAGVDHIGGVVQSEENWRLPPLREALKVAREAGRRGSLIPLFSRPESVFCAIDYYQPDMIHFCDAIDGIHEGTRFDAMVHLQESVRNRYPNLLIMRSIPIPPAGQSPEFPVLEIARRFEPVSDFFLTDTLLSADRDVPGDHQPEQGFVGITGKICDWERAARLIETTSLPVILAGGVSPDNVREGILRTRPAGVDSCTLTNQLDASGKPIRFRKDFRKVTRLVEEARRAGNHLNHDIKV